MSLSEVTPFRTLKTLMPQHMFPCTPSAYHVARSHQPSLQKSEGRTRASEETYLDLMLERGVLTRRSTREEDMFEHVDFVHLARVMDLLTLLGARRVYTDDLEQSVEFTVDVKGLKKTARGDARYSNGILWLEYRDVNGNPGWLQAPNLDVIACQVSSVRDACPADAEQDGFVFLNRRLLLDWILSRVDMDGEPVRRPWQALYKTYARADRPDERVILVPLLDAFQAAGCGVLFR